MKVIAAAPPPDTPFFVAAASVDSAVDVVVVVVVVETTLMVERHWSSPGWQSVEPLHFLPFFADGVLTEWSRSAATSHAAVHSLCSSTQSMFSGA